MADKLQLIAKAAGAGSKSLVLPKGTSIFVDGTLTTETITVEYVGLDDSTTTPAYDEYGQALVLSVSRTDLVLSATAHVKFTKGVTTNAVGVYAILA